MPALGGGEPGQRPGALIAERRRVVSRKVGTFFRIVHLSGKGRLAKFYPGALITLRPVLAVRKGGIEKLVIYFMEKSEIFVTIFRSNTKQAELRNPPLCTTCMSEGGFIIYAN